MSSAINKGGFVLVNGGLKYCVAVPSNRPYCHFCRQRVAQVLVLERSQGNPLNICESCLSARLNGFESIPES